MAVGLRIRNQTTSQIQIGNGYRNLQLVKSGTLDVNNFVGGGDITYTRATSGLLTSTSGNDLMHVFRLVNGTISNSTFFTAMQESNFFKVYVNKSSPNKTFEYYTFGYSSNQPTGPVGLRLKNDDGTTLYDSRKKALRVLASITLPNSESLDPINLGQYFPGTKIGISIPNPRFYYRAPFPEQCYCNADALHMDSNNNVYYSRPQLWSQNLGSSSRFPVGQAQMGSATATAFVIDLTEVPLNFTA